MSTVAKVIRGTADISRTGVHIVSAIQVIGGTAAFSVYNDTSAVAGNKIAEGVAAAAPGTTLEFNTPVRVENLFVDVGVGATEVFVHLV